MAFLFVATPLAGWSGAETQDAAPLPQHLRDFPSADLSAPTPWTTCAFDVRNPEDQSAECAFVTVPLNYAKPKAGTFRLLVKRTKATVKPTAQVWILHGGPGASATEGMYRLSYGVSADRPDIVYYGVDHRGIGGSEKLECPQQEAKDSAKGSTISEEEWPQCIKAVLENPGRKRLNQITTSNAARDIGALIAKYREPGVKVVVYGGSYGSYLARRYLQLFPDQPDAVILEGLASNQAFTDYDSAMNDAAKANLDACAAYPDCARHFDGHPWEIAQQVLHGLPTSACSALKVSPGDMKKLWGAFTFTAPNRSMLPALVKRLQRCNENDMAFIIKGLTQFIAILGEAKASSAVILKHVGISEMLGANRDAAGLQQQFSETLTMSTGLEAELAGLQSRWPTYPRDDYMGDWPDYRGPMLMLHGALDTPAPLHRALEVRAHFQAPHQYWVLFPEGAHGMVTKTPDANGRDCGKYIYVQFVDQPLKAPDQTCIGDILPINWNGNPADAVRIFGTEDIWGDEAATEIGS